MPVTDGSYRSYAFVEDRSIWHIKEEKAPLTPGIFGACAAKASHSSVTRKTNQFGKAFGRFKMALLECLI